MDIRHPSWHRVGETNAAEQQEVLNPLSAAAAVSSARALTQGTSASLCRAHRLTPCALHAAGLQQGRRLQAMAQGKAGPPGAARPGSAAPSDRPPSSLTGRYGADTCMPPDLRARHMRLTFFLSSPPTGSVTNTSTPATSSQSTIRPHLQTTGTPAAGTPAYLREEARKPTHSLLKPFLLRLTSVPSLNTT